MNRWLPWIGSAALVAVGGGAVYMSTVGLGGTQAATLDYITQAATQSDVTVASAASGNVTSAASYTLAFGSEPSLDGTTASTSTWDVQDVLVAIGDRVAAGQVLAVADTSELEDQITALQTDLERARLTLTEARSARKAAPDVLEAAIDAALLEIKSLNLQLDQAKDERNDTTKGTAARTQAQIKVDQLKAQVAEAKQTRNDLKAERKSGFPAETLAVTEAKLAVSDLESQLADLQEQIELASIVAPVDGIVSELNVTAGFTAPTGAAAVIDSDTLEIVASVVESDIGSLVVGQAATVSIDAVDQDVAGVVTSVVPTTSGSTSSVVSYPVTVTLTDPDSSVLSGMGSEVEIIIDQATDVVAVPVTALSGRDGNYTVQVVGDDGSTEVRTVTVGLVTETLAEIQSGLSAGEEVVVGTAADRTESEDDEAESAFGGMGGMDMGGGMGGGMGGPPAGGRPGGQ